MRWRFYALVDNCRYYRAYGVSYHPAARCFWWALQEDGTYIRGDTLKRVVFWRYLNSWPGDLCVVRSAIRGELFAGAEGNKLLQDLAEPSLEMSGDFKLRKQ